MTYIQSSDLVKSLDLQAINLTFKSLKLWVILINIFSFKFQAIRSIVKCEKKQNSRYYCKLLLRNCFLTVSINKLIFSLTIACMHAWCEYWILWDATGMIKKRNSSKKFKSDTSFWNFYVPYIFIHILLFSLLLLWW